MQVCFVISKEKTINKGRINRKMNGNFSNHYNTFFLESQITLLLSLLSKSSVSFSVIYHPIGTSVTTYFDHI